jgi:stringent starvation protein B
MASGTAKLNQLRELLAQGVATVHLDARHDQVRVPLAYRIYDSLPLNLSYRYEGVNLHLDDEDLCATLTFQGKPFRCVIPWQAVWGVTAEGGRGQAWLEDVPVSVRLRISEQAEHARMQRRPRQPQWVN